LHSIAPTGRQPWDNPWNSSANAPYPADTLTERTPLLDALMGRPGTIYSGKGYPKLEKDYKKMASGH
jgi:hypothetical protein